MKRFPLENFINQIENNTIKKYSNRSEEKDENDKNFLYCLSLSSNYFFIINKDQIFDLINLLIKFYKIDLISEKELLLKNYNATCTHFGKFVHTGNQTKITVKEDFNSLNFLDAKRKLIYFGTGNVNEKKYTGTSAASEIKFSQFWSFSFIYNDKQETLKTMIENYIDDNNILKYLNITEKLETIDQIDLFNIQQTLMPIDAKGSKYFNLVVIPRIENILSLKNYYSENSYIEKFNLKIGGTQPINAGSVNSSLGGNITLYKHKNILVDNKNPKYLLNNGRIFNYNRSEHLKNMLNILKNEQISKEKVIKIINNYLIEFLDDFLQNFNIIWNFLENNDKELIINRKESKIIVEEIFINKNLNLLKEKVYEQILKKISKQLEDLSFQRRKDINDTINKIINEYIEECYGK